MSELFERLKQGLDEADVFLAGESSKAEVRIPAGIDIKRIRTRLKMTQAAFAARFGFSVDAVRHWESGRRVPEAPARAYLRVIDANPEAVIAALEPTRRVAAKRRAAAPGRSVVLARPGRAKRVAGERM